MRATNLNYLTIIEKKDQMLQTAYSIVFAFSPFFTVGHCPLSLWLWYYLSQENFEFATFSQS